MRAPGAPANVMPLEMPDDPYFKLKPEQPTPQDELCRCSTPSEVYIAHKLSSNPIHCLVCNGEIPPEKLGFGATIAEQIANWNNLYGGLYALWLDSGEYEEWAKARLLDQSGQINKMGFDLVETLRPLKAYYLWFYASEESRPSKCPLCKGKLVSTGQRYLACDHCKIVV